MLLVRWLVRDGSRRGEAGSTIATRGWGHRRRAFVIHVSRWIVGVAARRRWWWMRGRWEMWCRWHPVGRMARRVRPALILTRIPFYGRISGTVRRVRLMRWMRRRRRGLMRRRMLLLLLLLLLPVIVLDRRVRLLFMMATIGVGMRLRGRSMSRRRRS